MGAAPRVTVRAVLAPALSTRSLARPEADDWPADPADGEPTYLLVGEHPPWAAALRADPTVRAFLDGGAAA